MRLTPGVVLEANESPLPLEGLCRRASVGGPRNGSLLREACVRLALYVSQRHNTSAPTGDRLILRRGWSPYQGRVRALAFE